MLACALVLAAVVLPDARGGATAAPARRPGSLDVFPLKAPCKYKDTFGAPRSGGRHHEGADIFAPRGHRVYAVRDGRITKKYFHALRAGNAVQITTSDGTYFFYAHLSRYAKGLSVGDKVHAGDVIGYVGSTGNAVTPHLHFEVHPRGGRAVNPTRYLRAVDRCDTDEPTTTTDAPTTTKKKKPTTTTDAPSGTESSGTDPAGQGARALRLVDTTFKAGIKTSVDVDPAGDTSPRLVRADVKIVASKAKGRGWLILGDCDHAGKSVLALVPGRPTVLTTVTRLSHEGKLCLTATFGVRLEVSLRRAWASDGTRLTVTKAATVFDSTSSGRRPSPSNVFKVRMDGSHGIPVGVKYLLLRVTATSDADAAITAGPCGRQRRTVATVGRGATERATAWVMVGGGDLCIGATHESSVHVDVLGSG